MSDPIACHVTMRPAAQTDNAVQPPQDVRLPESRRSSVLHRLVRQAPTLLVMAALAGLGVYGHRSDWKLPKFSSLIGNGAEARDDWCDEHGVPESQCVECRPDLLPRGTDYGWCKAHGVHECPLCHPEIAQLKAAPAGVEADLARAVRAMASASGPENNAICKNYRRRIQFASIEAVNKAGVEVAVVDRQPVVESLPANGQINYDGARFASLSSRLPGTVCRVEKDVGQQVRAGEVLALVDAAEVGRAKMELIQALAQEQLQRGALKRLEAVADMVPGGKLQEAQAATIQARAKSLSAQQAMANLGLAIDLEDFPKLPEEKQVTRLRLLGIPDELAGHLRPEEATANLLPLKAPMDGVIVARHAAAGEVVDASRTLFQLADTSRMWLTLNVSAEDVNKLALGQPVRFRPDGSRDEVSGKLVWISTTADQQTRMVTVRAELPNPNGQLRNETFGAGTIVLREEPEAIAVPSEAIHWEGCCHIVFVRDKGYFDSKESPKVFHVRTVRLGAARRPAGLVGESVTEIAAGVLPGEVVATKGSDVLRAELLKNNLGEGCCCGK